MSMLPQNKIDWYKKSMQKVSNLAAKSFIKEFNIFSKNANSNEDILKAAIRAGKNIINVVGDDAQNVACQYFNNIMELEGTDITADYIDDIIDTQYYINDVYYFMSQYENDKISKSDLAEKLENAIRYYIKRCAHDSIKENCRKKRIYYALVPSGHETCAFCFMLASRGFIYSGQTKKKHENVGFHKNCDCVLTPSHYGRLKVAGYDPDWYYDRYEEARREAHKNKKGPYGLKSSQITKAINDMAEKKGWDYMWGNKSS